MVGGFGSLAIVLASWVIRFIDCSLLRSGIDVEERAYHYLPAHARYRLLMSSDVLFTDAENVRLLGLRQRQL